MRALLVAAATRRSVEPPARRGPSRSGGQPLLDELRIGAGEAPPYAWRSTWRIQPLLPSRRLQAR
jgi:hypothetical protein